VCPRICRVVFTEVASRSWWDDMGVEGVLHRLRAISMGDTQIVVMAVAGPHELVD